jgi:hypothetical protein
MREKVLDAKMTLENSGFVASMGKAREATSKALDTFKGVALGLTGLGASFAAFRGVESISDSLRQAFEAGRQLVVLSRQTGESVKTLVQLQRAFTEAGLGADGVGTALFMLNKAMGGVNEEGMPTATAFQRIGLSLDNLKKMNAVDQFRAIINGLNKLPDQATKANVAMQMFGRGARDIQGILADPKGFEEAIKNSEAYANTMQRNAAIFERVQKTVEQIQENVKGFFAGVAAGIAPSLQKVLDALNSIDLTKIGAQVGSAIAVLGQAFQKGQLSDLLADELSIGFADATNNFVGILQAALQAIQKSLGVIFSPDFFSGLAQSFKGVAEALGAALLDALKGPINAIQSAISYQFDKHTAASNQRTAIENAGKFDKIADAAFKRANAIQDKNPEGAKREYGIADAATKQAGRERDNAAQYAQVASMNLPDYIKVHANDAVSFGGQTSDQMSTQGGQDILAGGAKLQKGLGEIGKVITDEASKWKAAKFLDPKLFKDGASKILAELLGSIQQGGADALASVKSAPGATQQGSAALKSPDADSRARLGFFIGGAPGGLNQNDLKRTADATEKNLAKLGLLVELFKSHGDHAGTAVYA